MYMDMVKWREDNPPPATMMIITNQMLDVFHWDLARLQQRTTYNLFLAYSVQPRAVLYVHTRKEWLWEKLLLGTTAAVTSSSADTADDAVFHCKTCSLDCLSLKSFKEHLSTKNHALEVTILSLSLSLSAYINLLFHCLQIAKKKKKFLLRFNVFNHPKFV